MSLETLLLGGLCVTSLTATNVYAYLSNVKSNEDDKESTSIQRKVSNTSDVTNIKSPRTIGRSLTDGSHYLIDASDQTKTLSKTDINNETIELNELYTNAEKALQTLEESLLDLERLQKISNTNANVQAVNKTKNTQAFNTWHKSMLNFSEGMEKRLNQASLDIEKLEHYLNDS